MKKLYNINTLEVINYPRDDDEPIIGLDDEFRVLEVISVEQPIYNHDTQTIVANNVVSLDNLTLMLDWSIEDISDDVIALQNAMNKNILIEQVKDAMAAKFDTLPLDIRATLFQVRVSVHAALNLGDFVLAKLMVQNTVVSSDLQSLKDQILALFP